MEALLTKSNGDLNKAWTLLAGKSESLKLKMLQEASPSLGFRGNVDLLFSGLEAGQGLIWREDLDYAVLLCLRAMTAKQRREHYDLDLTPAEQQKTGEPILNLEAAKALVKQVGSLTSPQTEQLAKERLELLGFHSDILQLALGLAVAFAKKPPGT